MVSEAQRPRRAGRLLRADARLARRPQRLVVRRHRLQRQPADVLAVAQPEGARPRGDAARAARRPARCRKLRRDGQPVVVEHAHGQGRRLRRLRGRGRQPTRPPTRPTRRAPDDHRGRRDAPTPRATRPSRGRPTSRRPRSSSTAAPPTLGYEVEDTALVTDHSVELTGLAPGTTYYVPRHARPTPPATPRPPRRRRPRSRTPAGALVDIRTAEFAAGTRAEHVRRRHARRHRRRGAARSRRVGEEFDGTGAARRLDLASRGRRRLRLRRRRLAARRQRPSRYTDAATSPGRARSSSRPRSSPSTTRASASRQRLQRLPVRGLHDRQQRRRHSALRRSAAPRPATRPTTPLPDVEPVRAAPLPDRVDADHGPATTSTARSSRRTPSRSPQRDAPDASATTASSAPASRSTGCAWAPTRRPARSPRACSTAARAPTTGSTLTATRTLPAGTAITYQTRTGATRDAGRDLVGLAERRRRRRDRQPGRALHPVPRAR